MSVMFGDWYKRVCNDLTKSGELKKLEECYNQQQNDNSRIRLLYEQKHISAQPAKESYTEKSNKESQVHRNAGNKHYTGKNLKEAVALYTKSICYAEFHSEEMALSFANRSAVLYELEEYDLCKHDILLAFQSKYPAKLHYKLFERLGKCYVTLNCNVEAMNAFKTSISKLSESGLSTEKLNEKVTVLSSSIKTCREKVDSVIQSRARKNVLYEVVPPVIENINDTFPCASTSFGIIDEIGKGRHAIAMQDIHAGDVIIVERPYTSICLPSNYDTHCYNCLKRFIVAYPCRNCAAIMYCSGDCEQKSWSLFHQYECFYMDTLVQDDIGLAHLALKMILLTGLEKLTAIEHRDVGLAKVANTIYGLNEDNLFESSDYYCVCSLVGNSELRKPSDLFRRSLLAIFLTQMLVEKAYFKDVNNSKHIFLVATHLLKQIQMLPCNAHEVSEMQLKGNDYANVELNEIGSAVYTTLSLLNHSCDPSVVRHCYGDTCVLRAIKYIREGEPIVDNYGFIYAVEEKSDRQKHIYEQYYFDCSCTPCLGNWPLYNELSDSDPSFNCFKCKSIHLNEKCNICNSVNNEIVSFSLRQEEFQKCMEYVLDTGDIEQNLPILIKYLNIVSKNVVLPHIQLNNCQEIIKLCFAMQGNFLKM